MIKQEPNSKKFRFDHGQTEGQVHLLSCAFAAKNAMVTDNFYGASEVTRLVRHMTYRENGEYSSKVRFTLSIKFVRVKIIYFVR